MTGGRGSIASTVAGESSSSKGAPGAGGTAGEAGAGASGAWARQHSPPPHPQHLQAAVLAPAEAKALLVTPLCAITNSSPKTMTKKRFKTDKLLLLGLAFGFFQLLDVCLRVFVEIF
jgi:hypothetical protein